MIAPVSHSEIDELHNEFLVFGDPESPHWFLGLEEAECPENETEEAADVFLNVLLNKARKFEQSKKMSLREFGVQKSPKCFLPPIDSSLDEYTLDTLYQPTWGGYIKLLLSMDSALNGSSWDLNEVKKYQKYRLGALGPPVDPLGSCLLELFPLGRKNRNNGKWPYKKLAARQGLEYLKSPKSYSRAVTATRVQVLIKLVDRYSPKYLMCFGADCQNAVRSVLRTSPEIIQIDQGDKKIAASVLQHKGTTVLFSNHPTSHGVSDKYWENLGRQLVNLTSGDRKKL